MPAHIQKAEGGPGRQERWMHTEGAVGHSELQVAGTELPATVCAGGAGEVPPPTAYAEGPDHKEASLPEPKLRSSGVPPLRHALPILGRCPGGRPGAGNPWYPHISRADKYCLVSQHPRIEPFPTAVGRRSQPQKLRDRCPELRQDGLLGNQPHKLVVAVVSKLAGKFP